MYQANSNQNTVVVNALEKPIQAHFIRLHPQKWYGHISLRMELYGCSLKAGQSFTIGHKASGSSLSNRRGNSLKSISEKYGTIMNIFTIPQFYLTKAVYRSSSLV